MTLTAVLATFLGVVAPLSARAGDVGSGLFCFGNAVSGASACTSDEAQIEETKASIGIGSAGAARSIEADVLVARLWSDINGAGSYFEIYWSAACNTGAGLDWQVASLPTFNDATSSFYGFASCKVKIWENSSYTGTSLGPVSSSSYVGSAMNDRASSVQGY